MKKSVFTKVFCLVLSIAIIALSIPFSAFAATDSSAKFAVVSDLHYFAEASMGPDKSKFAEVCKLNNSTTYLSKSVLDAVLANLAAKASAGEIEFVLLPGDLTKNAEYAAHAELAARLNQFESATGIPVYVVNGNHDINNDRAAKFDGTNWVDDKSATPEEFEALYANFGYNEALSRYEPADGDYEGSLSYTANIGDDYRLIAIDTQKYSADNTDSGLDEQETAGSMSKNLLNWVIKEIKKAKADGREPIALVHHNIIPHFETQVDLFESFVLRDWEVAADAMADSGLHYVFSGHVHMGDVASYVSDNGETIHDIATTSILNYPFQFRTCEIKTSADGTSSISYKIYDADELSPLVFNGTVMTQPMKYEGWAVNFGGDDIKNFVMNFIEYQLIYGFGKDIKDAGGLTAYVSDAIGLDTIVADMIDNEKIGSALGGISSVALETLLAGFLNQVDRKYLQDPEYTLEVLSPMIDELLAIKVADEKSVAFKDTLGFYSRGDYGTLGDLASTVLAYHYTNDENPYEDKFLTEALDRFNNGENAQVIVDTLLKVIVDDLLQDEILSAIKIDLISVGINGVAGDLIQGIIDAVNNAIGATGDWDGLGIGDIIAIILMSGIAGGDTLSDVIYGALDEYLTQSQYDTIDGEFYRILKDLTYDENPGICMDLNGTVSYSGKVAVPLSQENLRLPSHIAVTFGDDTATTRNISYFTKYSITDTDIQIVPYSANPDFSRGTTVDAVIDTDCEVNAVREYSSIDLSFIGILKHQIKVNRHTISVSGLEEGTKYCYRVGDADRNWWSEIGIIDTADNTNTFSFFHTTDPQSVTEKQYTENWAAVLNTAFTNHSDADFILNTGDLVDNGNDFVEWRRMFNSSANSLMDTALMTSSGNHEERGDNAQVENFCYTNLPEQDSATGAYYSFNYNTAHIAVLNTNDLNDENGLSDAQIQWLKDDMSASAMPWKFVALHKAPYSNGSHIDDDDVVAIRGQLQTLMPELDIDVVFQGHDHVYMRTDVMNNNAVVETKTKSIKHNGLEYASKISPEGTVYSINGTAGCKHYEPKPETETAEFFPTAEAVVSLDIPSYSYIQVDGGILYFDSYAVNADGSEDRIDSFAISKVITLPDGTVIDGTSNNQIGGSKTENVTGDIADTFREKSVLSYAVVAVASLAVIAGIVVTTVIIKRKREEA